MHNTRRPPLSLLSIKNSMNPNAKCNTNIQLCCLCKLSNNNTIDHIVTRNKYRVLPDIRLHEFKLQKTKMKRRSSVMCNIGGASFKVTIALLLLLYIQKSMNFALWCLANHLLQQWHNTTFVGNRMTTSKKKISFFRYRGEPLTLISKTKIRGHKVVQQNVKEH